MPSVPAVNRGAQCIVPAIGLLIGLIVLPDGEFVIPRYCFIVPDGHEIKPTPRPYQLVHNDFGHVTTSLRPINRPYFLINRFWTVCSRRAI